MSGRIAAKRISSRSLLWSYRSSSILIPRTATSAVGRGTGRGGGCIDGWCDDGGWTTTPSSPPSGGRFFSEQAYTPGIGIGKTSTGYVGLEVEPDWYNVMLTKFQQLLDRLEASDMPETAQYRVDVTKWCQYVIEQVKANPNNPEAVEDAVNMGQVEELIEMADDEMVAMDVYLRTRMWELVEQSGGPSVDFDPDPMKDPFAADGDPAVAEKLRKGMEAMKQEKK